MEVVRGGGSWRIEPGTRKQMQTIGRAQCRPDFRKTKTPRNGSGDLPGRRPGIAAGERAGREDHCGAPQDLEGSDQSQSLWRRKGSGKGDTLLSPSADGGVKGLTNPQAGPPGITRSPAQASAMAFVGRLSPAGRRRTAVATDTRRAAGRA